MKNLTNTIETTVPFLYDQGWCKVYAKPEMAAAAHDPTATLKTFFSDTQTHTTIFQYKTRKGDIAVRPWYEIVPFQDELEVVGYIHDEWLDKELPQ